MAELPDVQIIEWQAPQASRRVRYLLWALLGALLVAAGIALRLWMIARTGLDQIEGDLQAVVQQELWAVERGRPRLAHALATGSSDSTVPPQREEEYALLQGSSLRDTSPQDTSPQDTPSDVSRLEGEIESVLHLDERRATVRVTIRDAERGRAYRQLRFYRHSEAGWQRVEPSPALFGEWRTLETDYFTIEYLEIDAETVAQAAPRLDALAAAVAADFGITPIQGRGKRSEKITLRVTPFVESKMWWMVDDGTAVGSRAGTQAGRGFTVPSPSLYLTPAEISDADALLQSASYPLIGIWHDRAEQQRAEQHRVGQRSDTAQGERSSQGMIPWLAFLDAFSLWEFWESDVPLARWKGDIIAWLYHYPQARAAGDPASLPERYDEICQAYAEWKHVLVGNSLPLRCTELDRIAPLFAGFRARLNDLGPQGTVDIDSSDHAQQLVDCCLDSTRQARVIGLVTVLDYAVATYGREQLPVLLGALGEHTSWETLIPAVFGISAAEFERGWQADLARRYGSLK